MKIIFLTSFVSEENRYEFEKNTKLKMVEAASSLQYKFINGFISNVGNDNLYVINILPTGSFPKYFKSINICGSHIADKYGVVIGRSIPYCNIAYIKHISIRKNAWKELKKRLDEIKCKEIAIISYGNHPAISYLIKKARQYRKTVRSCRIIEDLPIYESLSKYRQNFRTKLISYFRRKENERITEADSFVFLTKYMAEGLGVKDKHNVVVEGIATNINDFVPIKKRTRSIVYCGSLHERFGIMDLIEAFKKLDVVGIKLIICGDGDCREKIIVETKCNANIIYLGMISREKALEIQKNCFIIVNPRRKEETYTKYSFPSKNLEALSMGTALIAYKLEGIPDDYDDYVFYVDEFCENGLTAIIKQVLEMDDEILEERCIRAMEYIKNNKSSEKQTKKITEMLAYEVFGVK